MKKTIIFLVAVMLLPAAFAGDEQISKGDEWLAIENDEVHRMMLVDVTNSGDACGIEVDGEVHWIDVGAEKRINGIYIKVFDAYPVHSQTKDNDACEFFISASLTKEYRKPLIAEVDEGPEPEEEKNFSEDINRTNETPEEEPSEENTTAEEEENVSAKESKKEKTSLWEKVLGFFRNLF